MLSNPLALVGGIVAAALLLSWFVSLERNGRPETVVYVILGVMLVQGMIYATETSAPVGPFRPGPIRTTELLVLAGVAARVIVRGLPRRVDVTGFAWFLFLAWYTAAAAVGILEGNDSNRVLFQGRAIVALGGMFVLGAGIPATALVEWSRLRRGMAVVGAAAGVQAALSLSSQWIDLPGFRNGGLGVVGADLASVLVTLALVGVLVELVRRPRPGLACLSALPMLLCVVATRQRASIVHAAVAGLIVLVVAFGPTWRRRIRATATEVGLAIAAVALVGLGLTLATADRDDVVPASVASLFEETFTSENQVQSGAARLMHWEEAWPLISDRPVFGFGLGTLYDAFRPGRGPLGEADDSAVFDNSYLDVAVRSGTIGLMLFLAAAILSLHRAWRAWQTGPDSVSAAVGLAAMVSLVGILAKASVESVLDKGAVVLVVGLLCGLSSRIVSDAREGHTDLAQPWAPTPAAASR